MPLAQPPPIGAQLLSEDTFADQRVYVTGGGTGLGKAIACEFARCGADIVVASRDAEHRQDGVNAIEAIGRHAVGVEVDIRDAGAVAESFDIVEAELGPVDVLINNAAGNFEVPAERMSANAFRTVVDIVLNGTFNCSREFASRRLQAGRGGAILNIGAPYAATGGPSTAHSAAAKAGVNNLTWSLAVEWAPDDIRINTLAPGYFPEPDRSGWVSPGAALDNRNAQIAERLTTLPGGRVGEARELGWLATFLCSPFASYITGHVVVLDGANWLRRGPIGNPFEPIRESFDRRREGGP